MKTLLLALIFASTAALAGPWDRLALVAAQVAADSASDAVQPPRMAQLVWQQSAKGPYGQDGLACTYSANGQQFVVFKPSYCPLEIAY